MYARFVERRRARPARALDEAVRELADGRVFLGPEAQALGLVDEVGDLNDAIAAAKELAAWLDTPVKIVRYAPAAGTIARTYTPTTSRRRESRECRAARLAERPSPQFMYLWAPGLVATP
jgi:ClpP class serine protease